MAPALRKSWIYFPMNKVSWRRYSSRAAVRIQKLNKAVDLIKAVVYFGGYKQAARRND